MTDADPLVSIDTAAVLAGTTRHDIEHRVTVGELRFEDSNRGRLVYLSDLTGDDL